MKYSEFQMPASDGLRLFGCEWKNCTNPAGVVCLIHGYGEHCGRYSHLAASLNVAGYTVLSMDLRGHGRSEGKRGHVPSYRHLMNDISKLLDESFKRYGSLPCFLYGHSMGGNLVLNYALRQEHHLCGVVATGPWLRLAFKIPKHKILLGYIMNAVYPSFTQKSGMDPKGLSHNLNSDETLIRDPLLHGYISARLFTSIHKSGMWALEHAGGFPVPLLLMHGGDDPITSVEASKQFAGKIEKNCTLKIWDGLYHEIHNEPQHQEIFEYTINWLKQHT